MKHLALTLLLLLLPFSLCARAEEHGCCSGCRKQCCLKPVCRLVCEPKTVTEVVYDCKCEDFCTPGPSKKCGEVCETDCHGHSHKRTLWQPTCGHVRHRNVLVKTECKKEVPHYKCVVEYVCDRCCCCDGRVPQEQAGQMMAQAQRLNEAAEKEAAATVASPAATEAPRRLLWPISLGK